MGISAPILKKDSSNLIRSKILHNSTKGWNIPLKEIIKNIPIVGPMATTIWRTYLNRQYPATKLARASVMNCLALAVEYVYAADVDGHIAEFGTMSGETAECLAGAMRLSEKTYRVPGRELHLFDSFQGLPDIESAIDAESRHVKSGVWRPRSCFVLTKERLGALVSAKLPRARVHIHDGWYKDTVRNLPKDSKFSLLHVDCDLYASTMDALVPLFTNAQISEGTIVLFDDWNPNRASPSHGERKAWSEITKRFSVSYSDEGSYGWAGHKFIIHSYRPTNGS